MCFHHACWLHCSPRMYVSYTFIWPILFIMIFFPAGCHNLLDYYPFTFQGQLRSLLAKLHGGQSVTVVAFGDSVVEKHGGCFHRDIHHLTRLGVKIPGGVYFRSHCNSALRVRGQRPEGERVQRPEGERAPPWSEPVTGLVFNSLPGD